MNIWAKNKEGNSEKVKEASKEEKKYQINGGEAGVDSEEEIGNLSRVVKIKEVQNVKFTDYTSQV